MVASLRSLGYTLPSAVADLIDNSIAATAQKIEVIFTWDGANSWIAVCDDGTGMSESELLRGLTVAAGGTSTNRSTTDLGRFGLGLKSASFSQADQLTVSTTPGDGNWYTKTWDLDVIHKVGEWRLLHGTDDDTAEVLERLKETRSNGTIVVWRRLRGYNLLKISDKEDKRKQKQFYSETYRVSEHLGMVFSRFLIGSKRRTLQVNGDEVEPWDPFMKHHSAVRSIPVESFVNGSTKATVEGFILPGKHRLSDREYDKGGGPDGWLNRQGFYVYRRKRLILAGGWLGYRGMRREEKFNLARIAVDIDAETDVEWAVDVRKSTVTPPIALRSDLERIALRAREQASEVLRHRGRTVGRGQSDPFQYIWKIGRDNEKVSCQINREHPLVESALQSASNKRAFHALLRFLEETFPVSALRIAHEVDSSDDHEPFGGHPTANDEMAGVAELIYQALVTSGYSPQGAKNKINTMYPFDQTTGFWSS
ncbi:ATP-binding protein [Umezawaea sp. NPDC059074]|uniref:ATP-binding protein n=1 Tax=Umezawaea sp. NPDC059074 TaxID=3346716 RepID=UPI0036AD2C3B